MPVSAKRLSQIHTHAHRYECIGQSDIIDHPLTFARNQAQRATAVLRRPVPAEISFAIF
jgi:hypothetical protein